MTAPLLNVAAVGDTIELRPTGSWTMINANLLESLFDAAAPQLAQAKRLRVDLAGVREIDTLGAWLLEKMSRGAEQAGHPVTLTGIDERHAELIEDVRKVNRSKRATQPRQNPIVARLEQAGRAAFGGLGEAAIFLLMLGATCWALIGVLRRPRSLRLTSLAYQTWQIGWQAIPIMLLITFLIGAIIAQQGIFHFRKFGAESYVVDMVGILVLREIGVLIVAIMVAGRSGSACTAELGSMKMREEIDALKVMGLNPVEVLVLPRLTALVIGLPLLTFIGNISAIMGGAMVAQFYGQIPIDIFFTRMQEEVAQRHIWVGLFKAPFMALIIGLVACIEGMRVKGSAESLGQQTTASVVKAIFLVIVLDGIFAILFASLGY